MLHAAVAFLSLALQAQPEQWRTFTLSGGREVRFLPPEFLESDYPASAIRNGVDGSTLLRLTVNPAGQIVGCAIQESSGSDELDAHACEVYRARARFELRNFSANHIVRAPVRWRLEASSAAPAPSSSVVAQTGAANPASLSSSRPATQAQISEATSQAEAQRILAEAIQGQTIEMPEITSTVTAVYHAVAPRPSERCITRYRLEVPQRFRLYQGIDAGPPVQIPIAGAYAVTGTVDWTRADTVETASDDRTGLLVRGRSVHSNYPQPHFFDGNRASVPIRADARARAIAAAEFMIRACRGTFHAPNPVLITNAGEREGISHDTPIEVTRQFLVTPENDSSGRYANALVLQARAGTRYRVEWRSSVPIEIVVAEDQFPRKAEVTLVPETRQPATSGSLVVTFTSGGMGLLGLTQARATSATGDRFGSDYRPYTVTITLLN